MSILENNVKAKIVETKSIEANITIQKILDMICKAWEQRLDQYYIMDSEPELSTDDCNDSVTVNLNCSDRANIDHIVDDVTEIFEEEIEKYIKEQKSIEVFNKIKEAKENPEEGENGVL